MELSNLALNLRGPWMITPEWAAIMAPVLKGVLQGFITEFDKAPEPYMVKCADFLPAPIGKANPYADKSIYVTSLHGTMMKYDQCDAPGTRSIAQGLLEADRNPDVIGHIIVADSGGGAADSVQEIGQAVQACEKPVVAFVDGIAASACLYAISYCEQIIAHDDMDSVGSIGTLIQLSGYKKFVESEDGYVQARIYADEAIEKNAGYEAALEGKFKIIKEERLNPLNERFIADMKANRPNIGDQHTSGKLFYAKDVVGTLIDSIGSFESAVQAVMNLAEGQQKSQQATNANTNSQIDMKKLYPTLLTLALLADQVFEADGSTTLQPSQLEAIEKALADGAGLQATIDGLNQQLTEAKNTITARDTRIKELEDSLAAAQERLDNPGPPAGVKVGHQPEGGANAEHKPSESFEEAVAVCEEFLKG